MVYDLQLAEKVEHYLINTKEITQKKMFGGLCFLYNGKMCCGVIKDKLVVRVGPEKYEIALQDKHTLPMDFTGKPLKGFIYVTPSGLKNNHSLLKWIELSLDFVKSLTEKK